MVMLMACLFLSVSLTAQDIDEPIDKLISFPSRILKKANNKYTQLESQMERKGERALEKLAKQEKKLKKKVWSQDSVLAKQLFEIDTISYNSLETSLKQKAGNVKGHPTYIPFLDTINTSYKFLQQYSSKVNKAAVTKTLEKVEGMSDKLHQAEKIQQLVKNRRQYLKEQLGKLQMTQALRSYSKQVYYYEAQISEYRSILKQPEKWEQKAVDLLRKTKPFKTFLELNSIVGSIFSPSATSVQAANVPLIAGAQTNSQVSTIMQQAFAGANSSSQVVQAGMAQAQDQLKQLNSKLTKGGNDSDDELRDFKPNSQKVKSFLKRIEIGTNLQSTKGNAWLPTSTQWGLSAGYRINDRSIAGIGVAGSLGWGQNIRHIKMSYEGVSTRSYLDWKLKGSFWLSAGYELNYQQTISSIEELQSLNAWQQSALVGLSKKYNINKKVKGKMSLLWDCLSYKQLPRTQPLIFRFGYSIK